MIKTKDELGNTIEIGSRVVFMQKGYRNLLVGEVIKITEKMLVIKHKKTNVGATETRQFHSQVVVVTLPEESSNE